MPKDYYFYGRNDFLLKHEVNKTFEEVLWMTEDEFKAWVVEMRKAVVYSWDVLGIPPRVGYDESEIRKQFEALDMFDLSKMEYEDRYEKLGWKDCIRNTHNLGNAANQWFPTMMKTRINYNKNDDGVSIYDHFADDNLLEKVFTYTHRHFKRDSFYHYSQVVKKNHKDSLFDCEDSVEWIQRFEKELWREKHGYDYWIEAQEEDAGYTGYNDKLRETLEPLFITEEQIQELGDLIPKKCKVNMYHRDTGFYRIRVFKLGQRIFPPGFKAFKVSWCQYATNFPTLIAKYIYQTYTNNEGQKNYIIWDPSAGWGGRILGAMSVRREEKQIHYIGTDPNTDHNTPDGRTKYHNLADFYNEATNHGISLFDDEDGFDDPHTYEIFQCGSEVMNQQPDFQKYKGKIDLVFTSPPYFAKEAYSEDEEQSYKKFPTYDGWRDGFLRPTLEIAFEWLKPGGYLIWNIADAKFGNDVLPLEEDSVQIIESLGLKYVRTHKMVLAQMPGGNRVDPDTGLPKCKNFCKIGGKWFKYEPIFVYQKL